MNQLLQWLILAFRNILKSRRRTIVSLTAIGFGFAAIALFKGYIHSVYEGLRGAAIHGAGIGHLTVYAKGWQAHGKSDPGQYMLSEEDMAKIAEIAHQTDHVVLTSPRLSISGLVSNGKTSTIFIATGVMPAHDKQIKGKFAAYNPITGEPLNPDEPYGAEMSQGLADLLELETGDDAVVMGTTLDGQMNAQDLHLNSTYDTGIADTNDKYIKVPLSFARSFYDTQKADSMVILLDDWQQTDLVGRKLLIRLAQAGVDVEIKTWKELSSFYNNVRNMFDMVFLFIFAIVFIIVVMSTTNTMGMAVVERTREIGTLRALGLRRCGVSLLFAAEGWLLGVFGCLFGLVLHTGAWMLISFIKPSYIPPGNSNHVCLTVDFLPENLFCLMIFMTCLALVSAIVPARRAAKQNIVESLAHV